MNNKEFGIIEVKPYGLIRLIGEKEPRRVNADTVEKLRALPKNYKGNVTIEELNLTTTLPQIAVMDIRFERVKVQESFMKLPTESLLLSQDGNILGRTCKERELQKQGATYCVAECHYREEKDGTHSYLTKSEQIPELLLMVPCPEGKEYPHSVAGIWHYGRKQEL